MKRQGQTDEEYKAHAKRLIYARTQGIYHNVDDVAMVAHVAKLATVIGITEIARRSGVARTTLSCHLHGRAGTTSRETISRVLAVRLLPGDFITSTDRGRGARRIINGLVAKGWTHAALAEYVPNAPRAVTALAAYGGYRTIPAEVYEEYMRMAEKLDTANPLDHGVALKSAKRNRSLAKRNGHAPLGCWDLDTIHEEDAIPDWTGACGTASGYYLHLKHDLYVRREGDKRFVLCSACCTAKADAVAHHKTHRAYDHDLVMKMWREGTDVNEIVNLLGARKRTIERIIGRYS